ncbi:MAG: DUF1574 domain-containing protein [Candidatus Obscuribacterales bacterium]|nr:DUF1574 domain-containing protein [Candidatus Obscuribacterales bacterium]
MEKHEKTTFKTVCTRSRALAVIAVVLCINLCLSFVNPFRKTNIQELPHDHSWLSWTTRDFAGQQQASDIVFLGSSLLLHPLCQLDAHYLKRPMDYVDHHRQNYTEDKVKEKFGTKSPLCFTFAMPGSLISDDWIIMDSLLKGERKPKIVVLGISVRDFIDNKVRCPGATPTFKYLSKLIDLDSILDLALPNLTDRTDYAIGKVAYLWGVKPGVQTYLSEKVRSITPAIGYKGKRFTDEELEKLLTVDINSELERGMLVEPPDREREFEDNTAEYSARYKTRHENLFKLEKTFFEKLLVTAEEHNIRLVVINMPLTSLNVKLMPPGLYDEYLDTVRGLTEKHGFLFANFNDDTKFPSSLFYDTAHMNSSGGKRFVDAVIELISQDKICTTRLSNDTASGIANSGIIK